MKNAKKQKIRMRGFDVAQFVAYGVIPSIKNLKSIYDSHNRFDVVIMHTQTGEIKNRYCSEPSDCTKLAKEVNKMLKDYEESMKSKEVTSR